jgi:putative two-component system response regulator
MVIGGSISRIADVAEVDRGVGVRPLHPESAFEGPYRCNVLLVGDDQPLLDAARLVLGEVGYRVFTADDSDAALARLGTVEIELLIVDMSMPARSGWDLIDHVHKTRSGLATIMLTATDDDALAQRALEIGAYGFMIKPFQRSELLIGASNALQRKSLEAENRDIRERLEDEVEVRTAELSTALQVLGHSEKSLRVSREDTIECLGIAAEFNDPGSAAHVRRMSRYCGLLAKWAGLDSDHCDMIRTTAIMHDVGKIGVPDAILLKPGKFTADEFQIMQRHAELGYRILSGPQSELLGLAATIAHTHHEKYDGSGYPRGLKGAEIPLEGRIAAVADVFDALTRDRPYREAFTLLAAIQILKDGRGSHFDPVLLDLFLANLDDALRAKQQEEAAAKARWQWLEDHRRAETLK